MRRLSGILLFIGVAFVVIVVLLVSGLRIVLSYFDVWRSEIFNKIEFAIGMSVEVS